MQDLAEKVQSIEERLDKLSSVFNTITKSLTKGRGKQRHFVPANVRHERPLWVEDILKGFNDLSTELRSVKEAIDTRTSPDSGYSQSDATATDTEAAPPSQCQPEIEQASQASPESESAATDAPAAPDRNVIAQEPTLQARQASLGSEVTLTPSTLTEPPSRGQPTEQVSQASSESVQRESVITNVPEPLAHPSATVLPDHDAVAQEPPSQPGEGALTTSTSTKSPNLPTKLSNKLHPQSEDGTAPTFRCKYKDISQTLNEAKFERFSSYPNVKEMGYFKLVVEDLPHFTLKDASFSQPGKDHSTNFSCHRDS